MLVEQILKWFNDIILSIIMILPSMPTEASQFDAILFIFATLNNVLDVPFIFVNIIILLNTSFAVYIAQFIAGLVYKAWLAVKW